MYSEPCARLITFMMPKISVSPAAIRNSMTPNCAPFSSCSTTVDHAAAPILLSRRCRSLVLLNYRRSETPSRRPAVRLPALEADGRIRCPARWCRIYEKRLLRRRLGLSRPVSRIRSAARQTACCPRAVRCGPAPVSGWPSWRAAASCGTCSGPASGACPMPMTRSPGRRPCAAPALLGGTSVMTAPFARSGSENCLRSSGVILASLRPKASTVAGGFGFSGSGGGGARPVRVQRGGLQLDLVLLAVAPDRQLYRLVRRGCRDESGQLAAALDRLTLIAQDDIARLQLGLRRRAAGIDRRDHRAARLVEPDGLGELLGHRLDAGADPAALDLAGSPSAAR